MNDVLTKGIIATPPITGAQLLTLGGRDFNTFFITSGNNIYMRKTHYPGQRPPGGD